MSKRPGKKRGVIPITSRHKKPGARKHTGTSRTEPTEPIDIKTKRTRPLIEAQKEAADRATRLRIQVDVMGYVFNHEMRTQGVGAILNVARAVWEQRGSPTRLDMLAAALADVLKKFEPL